MAPRPSFFFHHAMKATFLVISGLIVFSVITVEVFKSKVATAPHKNLLANPNLKPPSKEELANRHWETLRCPSFELYAYSAFYDDREYDAGVGPAAVRVMTVMRLMKVKLQCLLWYKDKVQPASVTSPGYAIGVGVQIGWKKYWEVMFNCPLKLADGIPTHVSIVCSSGIAKQPQFFLPVEVPERPAAKKDFAVCVCASYGKRDPYQLIEWMMLQRLWGSDKVTVYNNTVDDETAKVFLHFEQEGLVEFRQTPPFMSKWKGKFGVKVHKTPTINDCFYRNMHAYKKILVIDFDEMIVPRKHNNFSELIQAIDELLPGKSQPRSYLFSNDYFFFDLPQDSNESEKFATLRHRTRLPPSGHGYSMKSITDPQACLTMHHHYCWRKTKHYDRKEHTVFVDTSLGMNHHYKTCHFSDSQCAKLLQNFVGDDTMLRFKYYLVNHTAHHFESLGLPGA